MKRLVSIVIIIALLAGFAFWWNSPAQIITRRTQALLQTLTMERKDSKVTRQGGVYQLDALLAEDVELDTPTIPEANGTFPRSEIISSFSSLCESAKQMRCKLEKIRSLEITDDDADISVILEALVDVANYHPVDGRYEVTFHWQRYKDHNWRLTRARCAEVK